MSCGNDVIPNECLGYITLQGPVVTENGNRFSKEKCSFFIKNIFDLTWVKELTHGEK